MGQLSERVPQPLPHLDASAPLGQAPQLRKELFTLVVGLGFQARGVEGDCLELPGRKVVGILSGKRSASFLDTPSLQCRPHSGTAALGKHSIVSSPYKTKGRHLNTHDLWGSLAKRRR